MELVIRIALMFFFIQFLVIVAIMAVTLLVTRPGIPVWGREPGNAGIMQAVAVAIHSPVRRLRSALRRVQSMHFHGGH